MFGHKWDLYAVPSSSKVQATLWEKGQKDCKDQRSGKTQQDHCAHEHSSCRDLHKTYKTKPVGILAQNVKGLMVLFLAKRL